MGANTFLKDCDSFGYKVQADTTTAAWHGIPRQSGQRIAIRAFGAGCGNVATEVHFMQVMATTTLNTGVATGTASIVLESNILGGDAAGNPTTLAVGDWVVVLQDDSVSHFAQCHSITSSTILLTNCLAFAGAVAAGNTIYGLGYFSDGGHVGYNMTASTQNTKELEGGLIYGKERGYPLLAYIQASAETALCNFDYLTVDYINS